MLPDGTQIWKFTHNGVDTHSVHFHMFNIELINRVGWDGAIRPPDPNEMGWKDTVRMSPLEDAIVAIKPIVPNLPWPLPNSIRPLDARRCRSGPPASSTRTSTRTAYPVTVVNHLVNYGWEYVFHCHLLGHEENDMMRPMLVGVAPITPSIGSVDGRQGQGQASRHRVQFVDNSVNETGFTVQRSADGGTTWTTVGTVLGRRPIWNAATQTVTDCRCLRRWRPCPSRTRPSSSGTTYVYRAIANNVIGDTQTAGLPEHVDRLGAVRGVEQRHRRKAE